MHAGHAGMRGTIEASGVRRAFHHGPCSLLNLAGQRGGHGSVCSGREKGFCVCEDRQRLQEKRWCGGGLKRQLLKYGADHAKVSQCARLAGVVV